MKKLLLILGVLVLSASTSFSQVIVCKNGTMSFFQETPVEDIDGRSNKLLSVIDTKTNIIAYKVEMTSFTFEKSLMQDHFNENYVESGKYPYALFKGQINETIDWSKNGTYPISATGMLTMHGVTKTITEKGILTIANGVPTITNRFNIKFTDYGVEIPSLLIKQLSDIVEVSINCTYVPLKK